jgi:hypothetical protein
MQFAQNVEPLSVLLAPLASHAPSMRPHSHGHVQPTRSPQVLPCIYPSLLLQRRRAAPLPPSAVGTIGQRHGTPSLRASIVDLLATSRFPVVQSLPAQQTLPVEQITLPTSQLMLPVQDSLLLSHRPALQIRSTPLIDSTRFSPLALTATQATPAAQACCKPAHYSTPLSSIAPAFSRKCRPPNWRTSGMSTRPATALCPMPGCGKMLTRFYLTAHMKVHNRERPYSCGFCTLHFRWKSNMVRHVRTVHRAAV